MKIKLQYEITEFTEADAKDFDAVRNQIVLETATLHMILIEAARVHRAERLQEMDKAEQYRIDEQRRWARFMHFCHTGVML